MENTHEGHFDPMRRYAKVILVHECGWCTGGKWKDGATCDNCGGVPTFQEEIRLETFLRELGVAFKEDQDSENYDPPPPPRRLCIKTVP